MSPPGKITEVRPPVADSLAGVSAVSLLVRPNSHAILDQPLPAPSRLLTIFGGAIAIGSIAAAVGAFYITLSVVLPPGILGFFLGTLTVAVVLSIVASFLVFRRLTRRLRAWLAAPGDAVDHEAWFEALNFSVMISLTVGIGALAVSVVVALAAWIFSGSASIALHVVIGGLLAGLLDAIFAWLFTDHQMRELLQAMAARDPLLPVSGPGIISLGLGAKMAIVIVGVSVVGSVVAGTLAFRGAEAAVATGEISGLAFKILAVTVAGLAVSLSGCLLVARHITGPLEELTQMLAELIPERYGNRALPRNSDEAGQLMAAVNQMLGGLEEREFIKDAFGRYVTRQVSEIVLQGGLNLGGELLEVTVLMSDIRDFTPMTESLPPRRLVGLLNRYFTEMVEECVEQGGMIDKFIGDAIMVVFGAPVRVPAEESARRAARAALGMRRRLVALNRQLAMEGLPVLKIGIGVHSGEAIAGNIGAPQRLDYTVIGDSVNVCARIESTCKTLDQDILISEVTRELLGDAAVVSEPYDIQLKGKSQSTRILALLDLHEEEGARARDDAG
ncbi:MAG: adenylate/guanylate cyclase domain-containing protein [Myxococcales bacterium]|nr:adenylate/guanylate cyclase domain-containing protein [Myxococcales bacterium]MCB9706843.1 adenylate/guanylate cyclase domain-containing protein [Myxococcales bacterium]